MNALGGEAIDAGVDILGDLIPGKKGKEIANKLKAPVKKIAKAGLAKGANAVDDAVMGKKGKKLKPGKKLKKKAPVEEKPKKKVKKLKLMKKKKIA